MKMLGLLKSSFHRLHYAHFEQAICVILRIPGLYCLDYLCKTSVGSFDTSDPLNLTARLFLLCQGLLLIFLPLKGLSTLYIHYVSLAMIFGAELLSRHYIATEKRDDLLATDPLSILNIESVPLPNLTRIQRQIAVISLHIIIATIISYLMDFNCNIKKAVLAVYTVPIAARLADAPNEYLSIIHNISTAITFLAIVYYLLMTLPKLVPYLRSGLREVAIEAEDLGVINAGIAIWNRVFVLQQLFIFWTLLIVQQIYWHCHGQQDSGAPLSTGIENREWYIVTVYIVSGACASTIGLGASCVAVIYLSWAALSLTTFVAQGLHALMTDRGLANAGTGEGITMILLALQTGLVDIPMPQRMGAMSIILVIVVGVLVQSMEELVEPVLLGLSASNAQSVARHLRVLLLCAFIFVFPMYMTVILLGLFDIGFWTLAVVSTFALTSVQVLGALTVYSLFLYDSIRMASTWEALDDVVYVARAVTRVLEFLIAVLVVAAGVFESMLVSSEGSSWSLLSGSALAVHCYYNVYVRLQSGWHSFLLRRDAARKIHSLPCATPDQLASRSHDVCAICYMEMKAARVTPCLHLFHATCLKKWLYVQDRCPLCSAQVTQDITAGDGASEEEEASVGPAEETASSNTCREEAGTSAPMGSSAMEANALPVF